MLLLEPSSSACAQGTRRRRLHLWGVCDPGCAATREKPSRAQLVPVCARSVPLPVAVTAILPVAHPSLPGSTAFFSGAGKVAHEGVRKKMGIERGPGPTRRERISRAATRPPGALAGGAQGARVCSAGLQQKSTTKMRLKWATTTTTTITAVAATEVFNTKGHRDLSAVRVASGGSLEPPQQ